LSLTIQIQTQSGRWFAQGSGEVRREGQRNASLLTRQTSCLILRQPWLGGLWQSARRAFCHRAICQWL